MKKVKVTVFGSYSLPCGTDCDTEPLSPECSSCGTVDIMKKEAEHLKKRLEQKYENSIEFAYVDVESEEMNNYPVIRGMLRKLRLPITVINDEPRLHGALFFKKSTEIIDEILK